MRQTHKKVNRNLEKLKAELVKQEIKLAQETTKPDIAQHHRYDNRRWLDYFRLTSYSLLKESEEAILSCLKTPWTTHHVNLGPIIGEADCKISTLSLNTESPNTPIVLVHGLGAGSAMWALNLDELAKARPVYAIDLLGFGRSSRPTFSTDPLEAEAQIARSIEAWRQAMKLEKIILCGHSFGAYLSTAYSLMYPANVARLILVDPWGLNDKPSDLTKTPLHFRLIVRLLQDMNPLSVVRIAGWMGPKLIQKIRPDFGRIFEVSVNNAKAKIANYLYHCNARNATGETAYHTLMSCLAWAKYPMGHRLPNLDKNISLTIFYGSETWLDHIPFEEIRAMRENSECSTHLIQGGGHHLYAEQKEEFNQIVANDCALTDDRLNQVFAKTQLASQLIKSTHNLREQNIRTR